MFAGVINRDMTARVGRHPSPRPPLAVLEALIRAPRSQGHSTKLKPGDHHRGARTLVERMGCPDDGTESRSHLSPLFSKPRGLRKGSTGTWQGPHRSGGRVPSTPLSSSQAIAAVSFPASLTAPGPTGDGAGSESHSPPSRTRPTTLRRSLPEPERDS